MKLKTPETKRSRNFLFNLIIDFTAHVLNSKLVGAATLNASLLSTNAAKKLPAVVVVI